jgi:hypothetical protein
VKILKCGLTGGCAELAAAVWIERKRCLAIVAQHAAGESAATEHPSEASCLHDRDNCPAQIIADIEKGE